MVLVFATVIMPQDGACDITHSISATLSSQGIETFLEGFEDASEAWDVVSRLRCEARRVRRKIRYEVR
jgi:hypothetical protein